MYDVITIGTATRDIFLTSPFFKVVRDKKHLKKNGFPTGEAQCFALGGKIEVNKPILTTGGGATNAAVTFARQGFKTASLIKVGGDGAGEGIILELADEKIKSFAVRNGENGTAASTILLSPNGERTILVYRGASEDLKIGDVPFGKFKAKWVYIAPGNIHYAVIKKICDFFAKNGISVAINPSKGLIKTGIEKLKPIFKFSRVVILNREEASVLTGVDYNKEKEIFKRLDDAVLGIVAMTDGPKGVLVSDGENIYKAGIFKEKKAVDRTGAGDAFGSGFVAGLMRCQEECQKGMCRFDNIEYAVRLGSANATSVLENIGAKTGIIGKKEFEQSSRWKNFPIEVRRL